MATSGERLLDSVARAVSDGDDVDWTQVEGNAPDPETRALLHELRVVAEIADLHRKSAREDAFAENTSPTPVEPPFDQPEPLYKSETPVPLKSGPRLHSSGAGSGQSRVRVTPPPPRLQASDTWAHLSLRDIIGRGAYGTIYRAFDPRLDREVALKLIPEAINRPYADQVIQEAKLLARVHHPNVVTIYGAARAEHCVGLWMELIEGQTLEQILQERGRFSAREATLVGLDVCEALAAVHGAGLLHRDVKAHNVMRDRNGRIVLMDFGAGRERERVLPSDVSIADVAGTPLYMAPELFLGGEASVRSDVYSTGVLLYRLVTGRVPITARSLDEIKQIHASGQARRLRDERSDLPASFVQIVERALSPDAAKRFESAGAFEMALTGLLTATSDGAHSQPSPRRASLMWLASADVGDRRSLASAVSIVAFVLLAMVLSGWLLWSSGRRHGTANAAGAGPQARFVLYPPPQTEFETFSLSPDGRVLAFTAAGQLWIRPLDALEATRFEDTQGAHDPFWSPDGRSIAYFRGTSLWLISSAGGPSRALCPAWNAGGGSWGPDGTILFAADLGRAIYRVSAQTGDRHTVRLQGTHGFDLQWPVFLPSGEGFIYSARRTADGPRGILVGAFDNEPDTWLLATDSHARISDGRLLYVRDGTLYAQPFDASRPRLSGEPVRVADRVQANLYIREDFANFTVSNNGTGVSSASMAGGASMGGGGAASAVGASTLAYLGGARITDRELTWVSRTGERERILGPGEYRDFALSHSGLELAYEERDADTGTRDLWILDLARKQARRITSAPGDEIAPVWSQDDRAIYYVVTDQGQHRIVSRAADGTGAEETIFGERPALVPFGSDAGLLTFTRLDQHRDSDLWMTTVDAAHEQRALRETEFRENEPRLSPDGKWFAYSSTDSSHRQVYIERTASPGPRWQVSTVNGREPQWRGDGREIYFHGPDRQLMVSTVDLSGATPRIGPPQPLFELKFRGWDTRYHYVPAPDGHRFILNMPVEGSMPVPVTVVINWPGR
jgi:Tol biopolymer transport system component